MALAGLRDKVAVVTGGASGMGAATAKRLSAEGAHVVVVDRNADGAASVAESLEGPALAVSADVSTEDGVERYVAAAVEKFGHVDLFHNNAGVGGALAPTWEMSVEQFDDTMAVNARGVFLGLRAVLRQMVQDGTRGAIVNTASVSGRRGVPGQAAYGASKHAVLGLTKVAAAEAGPLGIRVNAVCPGLVQTPLLQGLLDELGDDILGPMLARVPLGRLAQAEEVANLVAWLLSDEASYVQGEALTVDGGIAAG